MPAVCICGSQIASGQNTFMMTYGVTGDEEGRKLIIRSDGNIQIAGWTNSFGITHDDIYTLVIDECGQVLCSSTNGGNRGNLVERGLSLVEIPNGEIAICGDVNAPAQTGKNFYTYSVDFDNCNLHIANEIVQGSADEFARDVTTFSDHGDDYIVVCGHTNSPNLVQHSSSPILADFYIHKVIAGSRQKILFHSYGTELDERAEAIASYDRRYYVAGRCQNPQEQRYDACFLSIIYLNGFPLFFYRYDFRLESQLQGLKFTPSSGLNPNQMVAWPDGFILVGHIVNGLGILGLCQSDNSGKDVLVIRTDLIGNIQWSFVYGGCSSSEEGFEIFTDSNDDFIVAGYRESNNNSDGILLKIDPNGQLLIAHKYFGDLNERLYSVKQGPTGDFYACGWSNSFSSSGDKDVILIRTDQALRLSSSICYDTLNWIYRKIRVDTSSIELYSSDSIYNNLHLLDTVLTVSDTICLDCN